MIELFVVLITRNVYSMNAHAWFGPMPIIYRFSNYY